MDKKATKFIVRTLYQLKREFGFNVVLYHIVAETFDPETGTKIPNVINKTINRAIILPKSLAIKFDHSKLDVEFSRGAYYDAETMVIIIDYKDLDDFIINESDYLTYNDERYNIKEIEEFALQTGLILKTKKIVGAPNTLIIETEFTDDLVLVDEVTQ